MKRLEFKQEFDTSIVSTFKMLQNDGLLKSSIDAEKQFAYGKSFCQDATKLDDYGIWFLPHSNLTDEVWNDAWKYEITIENDVFKSVVETFDSSKKRSEVELERAKNNNNNSPTRLIFAKDKSNKYIFLGVFTVEKPTRSYSYTKWNWRIVNSNYNY